MHHIVYQFGNELHKRIKLSGVLSEKQIVLRLPLVLFSFNIKLKISWAAVVYIPTIIESSVIYVGDESVSVLMALHIIEQHRIKFNSRRQRIPRIWAHQFRVLLENTFHQIGRVVDDM